MRVARCWPEFSKWTSAPEGWWRWRWWGWWILIVNKTAWPHVWHIANCLPAGCCSPPPLLGIDPPGGAHLTRALPVNIRRLDGWIFNQRVHEMLFLSRRQTTRDSGCGVTLQITPPPPPPPLQAHYALTVTASAHKHTHTCIKTLQCLIPVLPLFRRVCECLGI